MFPSDEDYKQYIGEENMTWNQWVNSEYNVDGYSLQYVNDSVTLIINSDGFGVIKPGDNGSVQHTDIIINNAYYGIG